MIKLFYFLLITIICSNLYSQHRVPEWAKQAVWYQIFPERFNNADKSNDPKPDDIIKAWPYFVPSDWRIKKWTSDWYAQSEWEKNTNLDFYSNCGLRRYGGDLQGVLNKLEYLNDLGITAIYFNPLFESPSLHKYDASMYHHIDNNFGPNPSLDKQIWSTENPGDASTWKWTSADSLFLTLVDSAHTLGIKVIMDGVFNHVGNTFWAFQDVVKNQENSNYKNWFTIKSWDDPQTEQNEFDYEGWYGIKDLPELREDSLGLTKDIANHIHQIIVRWMDPNGDGDPSDGIDGWRLDVADMVNINFWKQFRIWVKKVNPDAYITGEIWWDDWNNNKMMNAAPWLQGDTFDAVMNYRFAKAVKHFVINKNKISSESFADSIKSIMNDYNKDNFYALMNLYGSHDTERLASMIVNPQIKYDHGAIPSQNKSFKVRKPNEIEIKKQMLMVAIQMTMPGAPMIYYGDEAGMWGGDDPDCRKPMVWPELKYDTENHHPFNEKRPIDEVSFNLHLHDWYKKLIDIRKRNRALSIGEIKFVKNDSKNLLIYKRFNKNSEYMILVNNTEKKQMIDIGRLLNIPSKNYTELISNKTIIDLGKKGIVSINGYETFIIKIK